MQMLPIWFCMSVEPLHILVFKVKVQVAQLCLTLCNPMDYTVPGILQASTGVGSLSLLQGIFPTQGSNPDLPHCRWILYQLRHKGSPLVFKRVLNQPSAGTKGWLYACLFMKMIGTQQSFSNFVFYPCVRWLFSRNVRMINKCLFYSLFS